jgi:NAD(P)-dependent dehydrogenase (short-subunit alcohol dehydrogenase family)
MAETLLKRGQRVIATDINIEALQKNSQRFFFYLNEVCKRAKHCIRWTEAFGSERVIIKKLDVSNYAEWTSVYKEVLSTVGSIDVHMNIAGTKLT